MNKVTLNKVQLAQLVEYIRKCGFREPDVVMEILDHFACKVEEKLGEHPPYTLEQAMEAAHGDFGVMGFHPIASEFRNAVQKKYRKLFRSQLKALFTSPLYLILFLCSGGLIYEGIRWTAIHPGNYFGGANDFMFWASIIYFGVFLLVRRRIFKERQTVIAGSLGIMNNYWYWPFVFNFFSSEHHAYNDKFVIVAIIWTAFLVFIGAREIAMARSIKIALTDINETNNNYNAVLG